MKYLFTFFFSLILLKASSQTLTARAYHGCGGATVAAFFSDPTWASTTYLFQRFEGSNWVTVHTNTNNWHLVTPGDIAVISNYRAIIRNNATGQEVVSNGVPVNPALFFITVPAPNPQVTMYWGADNTSGANYAEVLPYPNTAISPVSRPPYTFEYKKTTDGFWLNKIAATGVFIFPLDANAQYQFRVTDVCGQTSAITVAELSSITTATQTGGGANCSSVGTIQVGTLANGQNFAQRGPFTFGYALLPPGTPTNPVPDAILNSLNYQYPAGNITGLAHGQYVVRGRDRFGVLTKYALVNVNINPAAPFAVSNGPGTGYCQYFVGLQSNPHLKGIRQAGSSQPYTFSTGLIFSNLVRGIAYEAVLQDTCGRISAITPIQIPALAPRINSTLVNISGCNYTITVNADVCTTPEYGLLLSGSSTINWQTSNVFGNLPMIETCYTIFVKDTTSGLISQKQVCTDGIMADVFTGRDNPGCLSNYYAQVDLLSGVPPYSYSISYDGVNFTSPTSTNTFSKLAPGTYTIKAVDACGLSLSSTVSTVELGSVYYLKASGINSNCNNGDTLGGYLQFGLRLYQNDQVLSSPPYSVQLKEVTSITGNEVHYGKTVYSGQFTDTVFTIKGLEGNKDYGIFVTNGCGQSFTAAGRVANIYHIDAYSSPSPDVTLDNSDCIELFIIANNLPGNAVMKVFTGRDTLGTVIPMVNNNTSALLPGGYYTVKINIANYNGCYWEKTYELFAKTNDSTRAGQFDPTANSNFCAGISDTVGLYNNLINEAPGGNWFSNPALVWSNQAAGEFIPAHQAAVSYQINYVVNSDCGIMQQSFFDINVDPDYCQLWSLGDFQSAGSSAGCKSYSGNGWKHVFNNTGNLVYSINPGNGNTIQSVCWGVRAVDPFTNPRTTVINGSTVYFAARNFYIEPGSATIGNNPVRIRLYYTADEVNQLLNSLHGFPNATINNLRILKKKAGAGSPVNLDVVNDPGASSSLYTIITPTAVPYGSSGDYYFEFETTSFSEFAIVFSNNLALPVTWLSINGKIQNGNAIIKWATASETNTKTYEVEHGKDGLTFAKVGTTAAAGNSNAVRQYEFVHPSPANGKNYYRIKQIDLDGRFTYSSIIVLTNSDIRTGLIIAPNPVQKELTVFFNEPGSKTIQLYSLNGTLLRSEKVNGANNRHIINMANMASGVYMLQVTTAKGTEAYKIVKQ
jgi:hypothetical protein